MAIVLHRCKNLWVKPPGHIEFKDGSIYREESKEVAQRIRDGKLAETPRLQR